MSYRLRLLYLGSLDALIILIAVTLAYFLRFDFTVKPQYISMMPFILMAHIFVLIPLFVWFRMYRRVWQYASIGELVSLAKAVVLSELIIFVIFSFLRPQSPEYIVPRSIYVLSGVIIILGVGGSRLAWRMFKDNYMKKGSHHRPTLIVGAGQAGYLIAKELKHSNSDLCPVGFVDDDPGKWNLEVLSLPVLGGQAKIPEIVKNQNIDKIIIALPSASRAQISKILDICKNTKAHVKILPHVSNLMKKDISVDMAREVNIEDLLGRDTIIVDLKGIAGYIKQQVVLVTGAGGSIGSELCRQIASFNPKKLILVGQGENSIYNIDLELRGLFPHLNLEPVIGDVKDLERIEEVFFTYHPSVVFHAAAHKHVPLMEQNPAEALKNNVLGTRNVAVTAHKFRASRFILISTDKAVNPTNVMGASKRITEMIIQSLGKISETKFSAVRFGNVLGSRGSVVPLFKKQIEAGGPVTVTHPAILRYFMTIPEAVQLVIQAGALANGGEIFVLDMGQPVKIVDLAKDLIRLSGFEPEQDIKIVFTGLRPGEKLYEELLTDEEGITSTLHERIFIGRPGDFSWNEIQFWLKRLETVISEKNPSRRGEEIKKMLKLVVPSYNPSVSTDEIIVALQESASTQE